MISCMIKKIQKIKRTLLEYNPTRVGSINLNAKILENQMFDSKI